MPNMLARGVQWLDGKRRAYLSTTVTYRRAADEAEVPAAFGTTTYDLLDEDGSVIKAKGADFIIAREDLSDFGEPEVGDVIVVEGGEGEESLAYEVLPLAGENHFRPHDPHNRAYRIHTKLTGPCPV